MSRLHRADATFVRFVVLLALLAAAPGVVFAQGGAVKVPANAYPTDASYGRGWECGWGYREDDETCAAIEVPAHGYLNSSGGRWECDRGYREDGDACIAVKVPANGFLAESTYGSGWECDRGYRAVDEACVAVKVPQNAHLGYSGNDWDCNRPYRKQGESCARP